VSKVKGYIEVTVKFSEENGQWVALCLELGTSAFGDTFEEAKEAIHDLMLLHLDSLESVDARKAFFKKHNIKLHRKEPKINTSKVSVRSGELVGRLPITVAA